MKITYLSWNDYEKNPICQFCLDYQKQKGNETEILYLKDLGDYIEKCNHTKAMINQYKSPSYVGDQLRLALALDRDMLYADLDCKADFDLLKPNTVCREMNTNGEIILNNGSFFYTTKNNEFNRFYFNKYQNPKTWEKDGKLLVNYEYFKLWPNNEALKSIDTKTLKDINGTHYYLSQFNRFKRICEDRRVIYYTLGSKPDFTKMHWILGETPFNDIGSLNNQFWTYNLKALGISLELWKEQVRYTLGSPFIQFIEIK